ncbi:MAG TPA: hypothetical protein RMH99_06630 [Sandaracinaceae bacterium LLY-WYZ-13_1]|nr:hypothetical protein [Sandaracinaceae bacterium LLY-WYZ-13_1]
MTGLFTNYPIEVVRVDEAGSATVVCPAGRGLPFCTVDAVVGEHVVMSADQGPGWRIAIAGPGDATLRPLIDLPDADDRIARTDGVEMVWMHAYGPLVRGRPSNIERWASPYATEPSGIEPRFVSRLSIRGPNSASAMGNGRAWVLESTGDLDTSEWVSAIYDPSSGERPAFHYPEGDYPMQAVYLGRDEVAIGVLPFGSTQDARTSRFIRYEALPVEPAP